MFQVEATLHFTLSVKGSYVFSIQILALDATRKELLNMYTWASIYTRKASQLLNFYSNFKKNEKILASHYHALNLKKRKQHPHCILEFNLDKIQLPFYSQVFQ